MDIFHIISDDRISDTDHVSEFSDDHVQVSGMMHLLISGEFENEDRLYRTLEDVYYNFTAIHIAAITLLTNFHEEYSYIELGREIGFLITFCRCSLKRMFEEDGITIKENLAVLMAEIERELVDLVEGLNHQLSCDEPNISQPVLFSEMKDLMEWIGEAYLEPVCNCYYFSSFDSTLEFLDQLVEDLDSMNMTWEGQKCIDNLKVLRTCLELLPIDLICNDDLQELLCVVEVVADGMACHSFVEKMCNSIVRGTYYSISSCSSRICCGILKALVLQSDCSSNSDPPMIDELVTGYVKCVQENILDLLKDKAIVLTHSLKVQLKTLHEGISFLMHLLTTYPLDHNSEQERLSTIWLSLHTLARDAGYIICLYFEDPKIEVMSRLLTDSINDVDLIKTYIIKAIFGMVLETTVLESPKQDQLGSLILLLQNLKEVMDHKPDLVIIWKEHENLVLFIFYLIHNDVRGVSCIGNDGFSRNTLHLDSPINHEELNGVLISAQVDAFNISCNSLLRRHEKLRWWELYLVTKEHVDMRRCVGILKAFVMSSTTPLTDELLIAYGECVVDSLIELLRFDAFDPLKDQLNILHDGVSLLARFLINYRDDQEKIPDIKVGFQDLVRSVGSVICLCFNNRRNGNTLTEQSTTELSNVVEKMNFIIVEVEELIHSIHINKVGRESPKTDQLGSLNLILENWKGLMERNSDLINTWKDEFKSIHENLVFFKSFITSSNRGDDESQKLCSSMVDASHMAEYLLTTFSAGTGPVQCRDRWISEFTKHAKLIEADVMKFNEKRGNIKEISCARDDPCYVNAQLLLVPIVMDMIVGFEVEMELIRDRLADHLEQLDVITIIGMPGLGKTTLARKAYEDRYTINHFDIRAWCSVSQEYNKKDLFLAILGSMIQLDGKTRELSETDLSVMVHKQLMGRRVILTSRSEVIGSEAKTRPDRDLIKPALLTDEQSWDLLERKVYNTGKCPPELQPIGKEIAQKCKGLPLAVVVVGGVLAKGTRKREYWELVTGNLTSYLARDPESQFMAALELSYQFLPDYLKPMFLYLGAFPEDREIRADKLIRLWIAEGFVQKTESDSLETRAEKNLMDLINRNLVMVAKRRWDGRVKAFHVHDLLRDMCLAKAIEENFMQQVHVDELSNPVMYQRRLSIIHTTDDETILRHLVAYTDLAKFSVTPPIFSLLFFHVGFDYNNRDSLEGIKPVISSLKLLKVFDAEMLNITRDVMDKDLSMLGHLRYLSFYASGNVHFIPSSISRLRSLETLIIRFAAPNVSIPVPETIWEMTKLRHLHINSYGKFSAASGNSPVLENLQTLSTFYIDVGGEEKFFRKVPNLKKLRCSLNQRCGTHQFPNLESLGKLESLSMSLSSYSDRSTLTGKFKLPFTLRKLSISYFKLRWSQISMFQTLPNLEVLKLERNSFEDEYWDMGDEDVFTNLKFLKLSGLVIRKWSASSENFPSLAKLVLHGCMKLEEIPTDLGGIDTLQMIEVRLCGRSAVRMAREIQKEQEHCGNESLKFNIQEI